MTTVGPVGMGAGTRVAGEPGASGSCASGTDAGGAAWLGAAAGVVCAGVWAEAAAQRTRVAAIKRPLGVVRSFITFKATLFFGAVAKRV